MESSGKICLFLSSACLFFALFLKDLLCTLRSTTKGKYLSRTRECQGRRKLLSVCTCLQVKVVLLIWVSILLPCGTLDIFLLIKPSLVHYLKEWENFHLQYLAFKILLNLQIQLEAVWKAFHHVQATLATNVYSHGPLDSHMTTPCCKGDRAGKQVARLHHLSL